MIDCYSSIVLNLLLLEKYKFKLILVMLVAYKLDSDSL